jgi:hypothetical protein
MVIYELFLSIYRNRKLKFLNRADRNGLMWEFWILHIAIPPLLLATKGNDATETGLTANVSPFVKGEGNTNG